MNFEKLNKKARYSMIIGDVIVLAISLNISSVIRNIIFSYDVPNMLKTAINVLYILLNGIFALNIIYEPTIAFKRRKYKIDENSIELLTGIYGIKHTVIPIRRLQQVDINQGMINRFFGLADINLITSGEDNKLEFIEIEKAELIVEILVKQINEFAKKQQEKTENYVGKIGEIDER